MLIRSVSLENIKSYRNATIRFQPGTNAISGENGAGKSTILEAIGYALFDYRPYKIESMVRHGEKKGEIRVTFTGTDEREYQVVRTIRTKGGTAKYLVHDPLLKMNIADSKHHGREGVLTALRDDIMAMGKGTDIQTLFEDVIGVPQGTILSPFLDTPAQRKEKFDPILGIEDFKEAHNKSGNILKKVERNIVDMEKEDASLTGQLDIYPDKLDEVAHLRKGIEELVKELLEHEGEMKGVGQKKSSLETLERSIRDMEGSLREVCVRKDGVTQRRTERERDLANARKSCEIVLSTKDDHDSYLKIEKQQKEFEEIRKKRDALLKKLNSKRPREAALKQQLSNLEKELKDIAQAQEQLPEVQEKVRVQKELEEKKAGMEKELGIKRERMQRLRKLQKEREDITGKLGSIAVKLKERDSLQKRIDQRYGLEAQLEAMKKRETEINTRVEHFQKSRGQLANGECPFFHEPCPKIPEDPSQLFRENEKELAPELKKLWGDIPETEAKLNEIKDIETTLVNLHTYLGREQPLKDSLRSVSTEMADLEAKIEHAPDESLLKEIDTTLREHGDFRGKHESISKDAARRSSVQMEHKARKDESEDLHTRIQGIEKDLEDFADLDVKKSELDARRDRHRKGYEDHRTHLKDSQKVGELERTMKGIQDQLREIDARIKESECQLSEKKKIFDEDGLKEVRKRFDELNRIIGTLNGQLRTHKEREAVLKKEITAMKELISKQKGLMKKLDVERYSETLMKHIREVFKRAPEYLRKRYVAAISQDANNRFHELMGDNSIDITWSEDYGISMRKGKDTTDFKLLSGGQQMAAALAVRLALIRKFSSLRIAFFDEPTHNLDDERRENLARAFYGVTGFDQLFVISHDETFNNVIENTIGVRLENGESIVVG